MNERREALRHAMHAPLMLLMTPEQEDDLRRQAPDLWSVRSVTARIAVWDDVSDDADATVEVRRQARWLAMLEPGDPRVQPSSDSRRYWNSVEGVAEREDRGDAAERRLEAREMIRKCMTVQGLTPGEHRVLLGMLKGDSTDEIARELGMRTHAVRVSIHRLRARFRHLLADR